ncbi:MAG: SDR family NAD(P)-dependent oxidoreductase [Myxococcaceae bacterium]
MRRKLKGASVVITGASSGIGRATALLLAKKGAWLTLVARREEPLETLRAEVERSGGRALVVAADVTETEALKDAARLANATYGGIDAWVNNAGVFVMGDLESTPDDVFHRTMEVNFHAYVYGARAVLPFLRSRGRGVLINVGSMESRITAPYATAYASSKFAVRALSKSLRQELRGSGIEVCTVMPPAVDTPLFEHGGNFAGKKLRPPDPVLSPERIAAAIASCILRPRPEIIGWRHTPDAWLKRGMKAALVTGLGSVAVRLIAGRKKRKGLRRFMPAFR